MKNPHILHPNEIPYHHEWPDNAHDPHGNVSVSVASIDGNGLCKSVMSEDDYNPMTLDEAKSEAREASKTCAYAELWYGESHYVFKAGKEQR